MLRSSEQMRSLGCASQGCAASKCKQTDEMSQNEIFYANTNKDTFVETKESEIEQLLKGSKSLNTQKSTNTALTRFKLYLKVRELPELEAIDTVELPSILTKFYTDVRTKAKGELYKTSSFKVLRAGLNGHFKVSRNLDIVSDERFMRANLVFDSVQVKAKKTGKGVTDSTPHISDEDLHRIAEYFSSDHVILPQPKILQQCVLFYIMFFFYRRGQENLLTMTKDTFKIVVQPDGTHYVIQAIDEKDKNHGINDTEASNQAKMYEDLGKKIVYINVNSPSNRTDKSKQKTCNLQLTKLFTK